MARIPKNVPQAQRPAAPAAAGFSSELKTIAIVAAVVGAAALWAFTRKKAEPEGGAAAAGAAASTALAPYAVPTPFKGAAEAPVILAKFTDLQCPFCTKMAVPLDEVVKALPEKVRLEYHHFPLSFHLAAEPSAVAAMAAHKQGKFFEMVNKLYAELKKQDPATVEGYAKELGLDVERFKKDAADPELLRYVRMDAKAGEAIGVGGTPSVFINGKKLEERETDKIKAAVEAEAAEVDKLVKAGKTVVEARRERIAINGGAQYVDLVLDQKPIAVDLAPPKPPEPPKPTPPDTTVYNAVVTPDDPFKGPADAPVTVVECTDFQCPFCKRGNDAMKEVHKAYPNDVRVIMKNRALDFHPKAIPAGRAAFAAHYQGKFWEMNDKIFENQQKMEDSDFEAFATELGLDVARWKADYTSQKTLDAVKAQDKACLKVGVQGTPGFFVNGRKLEGAKPFAEFKPVIDEELKKAKAELAKGIAPADIYTHMLKQGRKAAGSASFEGALQTIDTAGAPSAGPDTAPATLVIFSDFECPFCSRIVAPVHEAQKLLGDRLRVVFMQYPLNFHKNAMPAAKASLAAHRQGKFWPMHDRLFKNQKKLTPTDLETWARVEGLDVERFKADMADPALEAMANAQMKEGSRVGVSGTPTSFLNGRKLKAPPTDAELFVDLVEEEVFGRK